MMLNVHTRHVFIFVFITEEGLDNGRTHADTTAFLLRLEFAPT